ncbi:MAG: DUF3160 domain-containing protein [Deltaproteobacteria bacterium]|nr:DUF3160 domain-containing protein [Deltaproteobacteria bacterium]
MRKAVSSAPASALALLLCALACAMAACKRPTAESGPPPIGGTIGAPDAAPPDVAGVDAPARTDAGQPRAATAAEPAAPAEPPAEPPALSAAPLPPRPEPSDSLGPARRLTDPSLDARRPRFAPDGKRIAFFAGPEGEGDVYLVNADGTGLLRLTDDPADDRDPAWLPGGDAIVWSTNRAGGYDLWTMKPDGSSPARLTDLEGDELEPAPAPVAYRLVGVWPDPCSPDGAGAREAAVRDRIAFTSVTVRKSAVLFRSRDGTDQERISPEGSSCRSPAWAGDGRALAWVCDTRGGPTVFHAAARWDRSLAAALDALPATRSGAPACEPEALERWPNDPCLGGLPRHDVRYPGVAVSRPPDKLDHPTYSANGTLLLAAGGQPAGLRQRSLAGGEWSSVSGAPEGAARPVWSPDGTRVAFESAGEGGSAIHVAEADYYLRDVRDLADYPELWGAGRSTLLPRNEFVARPGEDREFFGLYERLEGAGRAPFLTVDAALQVFHDEYSVLLRAAERQAQNALLRLCGALYEKYLGRLTHGDDPVARYLAVTFAVPWVFLASADGMESRQPAPGNAGVDEPRPAEEQLRRLVPERVALLPEWVRADVEALAAAILAHEGQAALRPPDGEPSVVVDFSRFRLRGHYAASPLAGWFIAVEWLGVAPLPLDASAFELVRILESSDGASRPPPDLDDVATRLPAPPPETLGDLWDRVDTLLAALLGPPADVTVSHLRLVAREHPEWTAPFRKDLVEAALAELRGPAPAGGPEAGALEPPSSPAFAFLSRRRGLEDEYFARLAAPVVEGRAVPGALDLFAVLGNERALRLAHAAAEGQEWAERYRSALDALTAGQAEHPVPGYGPEDIHHSWLALLATLAQPAGWPHDSPLFFARTEAWLDRRLDAAIAGYARLAHDAVLYSAEEEALECGERQPLALLVEQPAIAPPRGFVDPAPRFFRALARLADRIYADLAEGEAPGAAADPASGFAGSELSARGLAERLATLADKEIRGEAFTGEEEEWIRTAGERMAVMLRGRSSRVERVRYDEGRVELGVALAADVFAARDGAGMLELAVGRVADLYVVVPDATGRRLVQGGIFGTFEFLEPGAEPLADGVWNERLLAGAVPPPPGWTASFLEPRAPGAPAPVPAAPRRP